MRDYGAVTVDPEAPHAATLLAALEAGPGLTHAVGLPDNTSAALFERLDRHASIDLLTVTREGEAFAIASGLWVGGESPIVIVQNTGLLESGDALRGTAARMEIPLLCLVTYRGYRSLLERGAESSPRAPGRLSDASLDSAVVQARSSFSCLVSTCGVPVRLDQTSVRDRRNLATVRRGKNRVRSTLKWADP